MKIAPAYISKKTLLKKLNKRNAQTIEEHIKVSQDINPSDAGFIDENKDRLARFAKRNRVLLYFKRGDDLFNNGTLMEVGKSHCFWHAYGGDFSNDLMKVDYLKKGEQVIYPDSVSPRKTVSEIKDVVRSILNAHKDESDLTFIDHRGVIRK